MQNQTGGWTLTWQGTGNTNADFPNGTTHPRRPPGGARRRQRDVRRDRRRRRPGGVRRRHRRDRRDAVRRGRRRPGPPLARGRAALPGGPRGARRGQRQGHAGRDRAPVGGRPLYVNKELNRSDAFVAAWLPGTEGGGVADVLVNGRATGRGFTGKLLLLVAGERLPDAAQRRRRGLRPAVPAGLRPGQPASRHGRPARRDLAGPAAATAAAAARRPRTWRSSTARTSRRTRATSARPDNWGGTEIGNDRAASSPTRTSTARTSDVNVQQDARKMTWNGRRRPVLPADRRNRTCAATSTPTARSCSTRSSPRRRRLGRSSARTAPTRASPRCHDEGCSPTWRAAPSTR